MLCQGFFFLFCSFPFLLVDLLVADDCPPKLSALAWSYLVRWFLLLLSLLSVFVVHRLPCSASLLCVCACVFSFLCRMWIVSFCVVAWSLLESLLIKPLSHLFFFLFFLILFLLSLSLLCACFYFVFFSGCQSFRFASLLGVTWNRCGSSSQWSWIRAESPRGRSGHGARKAERTLSFWPICEASSSLSSRSPAWMARRTDSIELRNYLHGYRQASFFLFSCLVFPLFVSLCCYCRCTIMFALVSFLFVLHSFIQRCLFKMDRVRLHFFSLPDLICAMFFFTISLLHVLFLFTFSLCQVLFRSLIVSSLFIFMFVFIFVQMPRCSSDRGVSTCRLWVCFKAKASVKERGTETDRQTERGRRRGGGPVSKQDREWKRESEEEAFRRRNDLPIGESSPIASQLFGYSRIFFFIHPLVPCFPLLHCITLHLHQLLSLLSRFLSLSHLLLLPLFLPLLHPLFLHWCDAVYLRHFVICYTACSRLLWCPSPADWLIHRISDW